jgi:hypothetical protein
MNFNRFLYLLRVILFLIVIVAYIVPVLLERIFITYIPDRYATPEIYFLFGWVYTIQAMIATVKISWPRIYEFIGSSITLVIALHWFLRVMTQSIIQSAMQSDNALHTVTAVIWRPRWTAFLIIAFVLIFIIGFASHGLMRQLVWLYNIPLFAVYSRLP